MFQAYFYSIEGPVKTRSIITKRFPMVGAKNYSISSKTIYFGRQQSCTAVFFAQKNVNQQDTELTRLP